MLTLTGLLAVLPRAFVIDLSVIYKQFAVSGRFAVGGNMSKLIDNTARANAGYERHLVVLYASVHMRSSLHDCIGPEPRITRIIGHDKYC
jgi:hypothetical protein